MPVYIYLYALNMSRRITSISLFALASSVMALASGCGEKVPLPATNSTYEISYSGNLALGDTIQFQSSTPAGKQVLWKFGDGESALEASPKHVYYSLAHNGNTIVEDTVILIVDNDIYKPNMKFFVLKPGVEKLAGNFSWKGGYFKMYGNCCPGLTDHGLNDTTFAISIVSETSIKTWGTVLPYLPDSNYYSNDRSSAGKYNGTWIRRTPDTLFFRQRAGSADGWAETTYFHKI
jgi:hypothetical protein